MSEYVKPNDLYAYNMFINFSCKIQFVAIAFLHCLPKLHFCKYNLKRMGMPAMQLGDTVIFFNAKILSLLPADVKEVGLDDLSIVGGLEHEEITNTQ